MEFLAKKYLMYSRVLWRKSYFHDLLYLIGMRNIPNSRLSKVVVDILMILVFALTVSFSKAKDVRFARRHSSHSYFGSILSLLFIVHIIQHWALLKALIKKELGNIKGNK